MSSATPLAQTTNRLDQAQSLARTELIKRANLELADDFALVAQLVHEHRLVLNDLNRPADSAIQFRAWSRRQFTAASSGWGRRESTSQATPVHCRPSITLSEHESKRVKSYRASKSLTSKLASSTFCEPRSLLSEQALKLAACLALAIAPSTRFAREVKL